MTYARDLLKIEAVFKTIVEKLKEFIVLAQNTLG